MNIFVTDPSPVLSAKALDSKRLIKMVLESAQLLSSSMHLLNIRGAPYRLTHKGHPCTVWTRTSRANFLWLIEHFRALCEEYTNRYGKTHKCFQYYSTFLEASYSVPDGPLTPFVNVTIYPEIQNVFDAYRKHLQTKWDNDKLRKGAVHG